MTAVAVLAPVIPLPVTQPKPLHRMRSGRECPVCAETRCMDADACAAEFAARTWMDCEECAGSGYDTLGFQIWCTVCGGAKVVEA